MMRDRPPEGMLTALAAAAAVGVPSAVSAPSPLARAFRPRARRSKYQPHQGMRERVRNLKRLVAAGTHWQCRGCGAIHAFATTTPVLTRLGATCPDSCRASQCWDRRDE